MIKLNELKISYHFQNDRNERKTRIDAIVNGNFGQVVIEEWYKDAWRCLTDTGLIAIVEPKKEIILTYYFAPLKTAQMMYKASFRKMPEAVTNKIKKNAKTYLQMYHESVDKPAGI